MTSHQEYGTAKGNFGGTVPVAETEGMRTRRECVEWIENYLFKNCGYNGPVSEPFIDKNNIQEIMQHCFAVAAKLLGKEQAEINQTELL